ncbi:integrase core domain-containing protein [Methylorubrum rhodinum]|uniref:integrase core domain-containing protein n=1 Tax=Methylorubrum rhodinum TaxID=29428 RepID=UPI000B1C0510
MSTVSLPDTVCPNASPAVFWASAVIERWRTHYNSTRPRSSLGHLPPAPEVVVRSAEPGGSAPSARPAIVMRPTVH